MEKINKSICHFLKIQMSVFSLKKEDQLQRKEEQKKYFTSRLKHNEHEFI
jgi:hypothetical protein